MQPGTFTNPPAAAPTIPPPGTTVAPGAAGTGTAAPAAAGAGTTAPAAGVVGGVTTAPVPGSRDIGTEAPMVANDVNGGFVFGSAGGLFSLAGSRGSSINGILVFVFFWCVSCLFPIAGQTMMVHPAQRTDGFLSSPGGSC